MLNIKDPSPRFGRRSFLQIGSLGMGGLSLPRLLQAGERTGIDKGRPITNRSVIFLFLHGGPSQIETFDPKMSAPVDIRSATGEIPTALPGITFGSSFPKLAQRASQVSIVRSFTTGDANHDIKPVVGRDTGGANLGSLYSRVAGTNHAQTGIPSNALLFPPAVDASTRPGTSAFGKFESTGTLGSGFAPFIPGTAGDLQEDMQLKLPMDRLGDRRALLSELDRVRAAFDVAGRLDALDRIQEQAFSTILGGVAGAFDLSKEDARTIARYDTAPLVRPDQIDKKWKNYNNYVDNAKSLGKLLLLARRLCEAGCGFVTVTTNFVWDMHADVNNATVEEGFRYMGGPLDHALAAFLDDVDARGLSNQILLVCCGEMGRTPRINRNAGRDHWGNLAPLLLAGGGLKMGQVIGQSTRNAGEPLTDPIGIRPLMATILGRLFDVGELRVTSGVPAEILRAAAEDPIPGLGA